MLDAAERRSEVLYHLSKRSRPSPSDTNVCTTMATKRRLAVVVSAARFNAAHQHKILAMITSTIGRWRVT